MPEINIPGVTASRYKTDELIEGLMRIERIPRERADADLQRYRDQQDAWRQLSRQVSALRDAARTLYSYNNPFTEKIAESSDSAAVSATATREAQDQEFSLSVSQTAAADSFLSAEIPEGASVPAGTYGFTVGEKTVRFSWKGGTFPDFVQSLNRRGDGTLRASLIRTAPGKRALLIESLQTGAGQRLGFEEAALDLALETGLIQKNTASSISADATEAQIPAGASQTIGFSEPARASRGLVLEYTVTAQTEAKPPEPETGDSPEETVPGPQIQKAGEITYNGVTIVSADSETALPAEEPVPPPPPPEPVVTGAVLSLRSTRGAAIPLPDIPQEGSQTFTIPLNEFGDVNALLVHNGNTARSVQISGIRIYDPAAAGEFTPVNPVSVARDAVAQYEGITITRPENEIDDLVPGVTLHLHGQTDRPADIRIEPDREAAKETVITFVANYNRVLAELNILTQNKPEIIQEIQYFTPEETEEAEKKLGMMQGETALNTLKAALQRITSSPYHSGDDAVYSLLAQIGISTRADSGGGIEASRLRGYLEINEEQLDSALEQSIQGVKDLFGYDTDGDMVIDSGAAVALDNQVTPYVQTGGIFATRTSGLGNRITETERRITQLDRQLEQKEADLRQKYSQMEGALNRLESQSDSISSFSRRQNSGN